MNLIKRQTKESSVITFRSFQYSLIPEMIALSLRYLIKLGFNYNKNIYKLDGSSIDFVDHISYAGFNHFCTKTAIIKLNTSNNFIQMSIPELIQGTFFILNGNMYIPTYYIVDEPIASKKRSVMLSSLFQSITLYIKDNRVTFMRGNIVLSDFLKIISINWDKAYKKQIGKLLEIDISSYPSKKALTLLSKKLNCDPEMSKIKEKIEMVFFDEWTTQLYKRFYRIEPNLDEVFKIAFRRYLDKKPSFVDLRYKRLTFIEPLLNPFFKAIGRASNTLLESGFQRHTLNIQLKEVVNHFFKKLDGASNYNTVNGYSGILSHRATFKNPFGTGMLPPEVSEIHWTHYDKICITSITNQNPGVNVFLVPDQELDMRFGIFKFAEDEMKRD